MGIKEGEAKGVFEKENVAYLETYKEGKLLEGKYFSPDKNLISSIEKGFGEKAIFKKGSLYMLVQYQKGEENGYVKFFTPENKLHLLYYQKDGKKQGEEIEYYPDGNSIEKLKIIWDDDTIHGTVKTWYPNGKLQSQREMSRNKKNGMGFAWYLNGDIMLIEEYENDELVKGSYYQKGLKDPISAIKEGSGLAHLYEDDGTFIRKVHYKKGKAVE